MTPFVRGLLAVIALTQLFGVLPVAAQTATYTVGGTVNGLVTGKTLVVNLRVNNSTTYTAIRTASGTYTFGTALPNGSSYSTTIAIQPANQFCSIANGLGIINGNNISNIDISCSNTYTVGGTVTGLTGGSLVLKLNNTITKIVAGNGTFSFATGLTTGTTYNVGIGIQPTGQTCSVTGGSGIMGNTNVGNISVSCTSTYAIGGAVTGLNAGNNVILQLNGTSNKPITTNGSFTFSTKLPAGSSYGVTVISQPSGQFCIVTNGIGVMPSNAISTIQVSCLNTYSLSGTNDTGANVTIDGATPTNSPSSAVAFNFSVRSNDSISLTATKTGHNCTVNGFTNPTVISAAISGLSISCSPLTYTVSGSVTGNNSTVIVTNNGVDQTVVSGGGPFSFTLNYGDNWNVSTSQPTGQTCLITGGPATGTAIQSSQSGILITCQTTTYTITGTNADGATVVSTGSTANNGNKTTNSTDVPVLLGIANHNDSMSLTASKPNASCTVDGLAIKNYNTITANIANVVVACSPIGAALNANIVLGSPTTDSITMKVFSATQNGSVSIAYGTASGNYSSTTPPASLVAGTPLTLNIAGLSTNTQYFYKVNYQSTSGLSQTPEYKFRTARPPGDSFSFVIQADPHMDEATEEALYDKTLNNIGAASPDFLMDLGDTFMTEKRAIQLIVSSPAASELEVVSRYQSDQNKFKAITHSIPLFLVNGNHDGELGWLATSTTINPSLPTWAYNTRKNYFPNPETNSFYSGQSPLVTGPKANYYSFKWGDALFVVLDPFFNSSKSAGSDGWNLTLGKPQYDWLTDTLTANAAMKYKFIFLHNLVGGLPDIDTTTGLPIVGATGGSMRGGIEAAKFFEWGGKNYDGTTDGFATKRPGWAKTIHQLLVDTNVTAVFHGHDHLYVDQVLDGIKYQEVPQPSARSTSNGATLAKEGGYLTGTMDSSSGFLKITVTPTSVTSDYIRSWLPIGTVGTNNVENGTTKVNGQISKTWTLTPTNTTSHTVSGKVASGGGLTGLGAGKSVTLVKNGVDSLSLSTNGDFTFPTPVLDGATYTVTIGTQPTGQNCAVTNGNGTISDANVSNVYVNCVDVLTYTVSGTIAGHSGNVTLTNNGSSPITIPAGTGTFTFPAQNAGSNWSVAVSASPSGQTCTVTNPSGSNINTNISNVSVTCFATTYNVSVTLTGNIGTNRTLILRLNGGTTDQLTFIANGSKTFGLTNGTGTLTGLTSGATYSVLVSTQPNQRNCIVTNGVGVIQASNVSINVNCVTSSTTAFTLGGTASNITSPVTMKLSINGTTNTNNDVVIPAGGTGFTFPNLITSGNSYTVTATSANQLCTVTNGNGTISSSVNNVNVACVPAYSIGGSISNLGSTKTLTLANTSNTGTTSQSITGTTASNIAFTFGALLPNGSSYNVAVTTQPTDQFCLVFNPSGTISAANVASISVTCVSNIIITAQITGLPTATTYLSGSVNLVLNGNATDTKTYTINGTQTFTATIPPGNPYSVTIANNNILDTTTKGRTCVVTNGIGVATTTTPTVAVVVTCKGTPAGTKYYVSGTVSGLTASGLVVNLNPVTGTGIAASTTLCNPINTYAECITLAAGSTGYAFASGINPGTFTSLITVVNPIGLSCSVVNNGTVTLPGVNSGNINITCVPASYTVSGTISGHTGSITLTNNGANPITIPVGTGNFSFPAQASGTNWNIAVSVSPAGQTCLVTNPSGNSISGNVSNVVVTCSDTLYSIGGNITGLGANPIILVNNGNNPLTVDTNGTFTFSIALTSGSSYNVTVGTPPTGMNCTVTNGTGTVNNANITSITVSCTNANSCSSASNATPPSSDPFWTIYSSPTDPDVDTTPILTTEQPNPFAACLGIP